VQGSQVSVGYKLTEVGVIPEDWEVLPIAELQPFVTSGSRGWAGFYSERGYPFIRITNLSRESIYPDLKDLKLVNLPLGVSEGTRTQLQDNDLLISITADIGIIGYVSPLIPKPSYINQHIALVRFDSSKVSSKFISYFLASENPQKLFWASTDTGAKAGMSLITVHKILVSLPPLKEQRSIARVLSDTDALITSLDKLIAKKRDIKQAAMQQLLTGKQRLEGFGGDWEVKRLGEIANITMGQSPSSAYYNVKGIGLPLIQGNADVRNRETIIRIYTSQVTKRCCKGDIILSVRAPVGEVARTSFDACIGRGVCAISYFNNFLYHLLIFIEPQWSKLSTGSTFDSVNSTEINNLEVYLPLNHTEQQAIAKVFSDMDSEISALEQRRDKTKALKQAMMQELLTGRIRLR